MDVVTEDTMPVEFDDVAGNAVVFGGNAGIGGKFGFDGAKYLHAGGIELVEPVLQLVALFCEAIADYFVGAFFEAQVGRVFGH